MKKLYKDINIEISGYSLIIITDGRQVINDSYDSYEELMGTICRVTNEIWKV